MPVAGNKLIGSVWRKWDLQVQTRVDRDYKCLANNTLNVADIQSLSSLTGLTVTEIVSQEKTITSEQYAKLFVGYLENFSDIDVIAVTNHNSGVEIDELMNEADINGKVTILPGVEVSSNQGIHILCIFDPLKRPHTTWAESVDHFLTDIQVPVPRFDVNGGPLNAQKSSQEILDITHKWGGVCIFAHVETQNGLFYRHSSTANGGNAHIDIYKHKFCNIIQVPRTSGLGAGVINITSGLDSQYGTKKVTKIQCSDSRKITDIGSCFCWIKADPTFEGLKQIIYEPTERVRLQSQSPYEDKKKLFFSNFKIEGSTNFLIKDISIPFNRELVTLIGGRGGGKSALLDTLAFLNEEHLKVDQNSKKKIIEFYRDNENHDNPPPSFLAKVDLVDKDGITQIFQKNLGEKDVLELPFLYLGQEQLSGLATNDAELTRTVCQLIGIDVAELNQHEHVQRARELIGRIENLNKDTFDIKERYKILGYKDSEDLSKWITEHLKKLADQQKRLSSKDTQAALEDINNKTKKGLKLKDLLTKAEFVLNYLQRLEVNSVVSELTQKVLEVYPDFKSISLFTSEQQVKEVEALKASITTDMDKLRQEVVDKKNELIRQGIKEDINTLLQSSSALQQEINNMEKDLELFSKAKQEIKSLKLERNNILDEVSRTLQALKQQIDDSFINFNISRDDSVPEEKDLFKKIIEGIEIEGQILFDDREFINYILGNVIDNRKISNETELRIALAGQNQDGTPKDLTFNAVSEWVKSDLYSCKYFNRGGEEKALSFVFTNWHKFLRIKTTVRLNGKPTEVLSIGQRGTLLLKVYLATATAKQIFIIDQPEDNLDNSFIMHELVPLIKKAKKSRQIIMSTHNANLVINADAEQVIVAQLDKEVPYFSGSIENPIINQHIKDILEGGEAAFLQREKKYKLDEIG